MASSEPLFLSSPPSSPEHLQQWLKKVPQTLQNLLSSGTSLQVCIFKLPETRTSEKTDYYIPQHIGLGPVHHFRTDIYSKQEKFKLVTAYKVLKAYKIMSKFENMVQESLVKLVPVAEYCYDLSFDLDKDVLAWVFAIDALVLIHVLSEVGKGRWAEYMEDVIMIENQIPLVILVKVGNALRRQKSTDFANSFLDSLFGEFCKRRSPFKFIMCESRFTLNTGDHFHLLDYVYDLIINHTVEGMEGDSLWDPVTIEVVETVVETAGELFPSLNVFFQAILLLLKLPWDKIGTLINRISGETPVLLEIDIPSVSLLTRIAKIEFNTTDGGIQDIEFDEEKLTFCLPVLDLKSDSEVILRNLVAYEESRFKNGTSTKLDFTEYVDFMCGIVDGVKDVKILQEKNIIVGGDMEDEEIVKLFNGISKSSVKLVDRGKKSKLQNTIEKVNKHYGNIPRIKVFRSAKKLFLASWKTIVVVFSIFSLLLTIYVGVYKFYDELGLGKVRLLIPYTIPNNSLLDF